MSNDSGAASKIGYVRVDDEFLPVTSLRLARRGFVIESRATGPRQAAGGVLRLYTPNHEPVTEWARGETSRVEIPALKAKDTVVVTWEITIDSFSPTP